MIPNKLLKSISLFIVLLIFTIITSCANNDSDVIESEETQINPQEVADVFLDGDFERVYKQTSKEFQNEVSAKQLREIGKDFNQGVDSYVLQSKLPADDDITQYVWTNEAESKGIIAALDESNIIVGLQVMPLETHSDTDNIFTEATFNLPFENEWFVFWGGTNPLVNYHYEFVNQRYAFDFLVMKENLTYDGDPTKNESYYAFGENMLAPADGTIVEVENNNKDNEPVGKMNEEEPLGNHVIIDHGNDEYSFLAHFKYNSIKFQKGDLVKEGDTLGLVGNSGNSSEPHIHFHVADSPNVHDSKSIRINLEEDKELTQGKFISLE